MYKSTCSYIVSKNIFKKVISSPTLTNLHYVYFETFQQLFLLLSRTFKVVVLLNPGKPTSNHKTCKNTGFVCIQLESVHKLKNPCDRIFWIPKLHTVKHNLANQLKKKIIQGLRYKNPGCFPGWQTIGGWEGIGEEISPCI